MTSEKKSKKQVATKIIVGVFLTLGAAGFIFSDTRIFSNSGNNQVIMTVDGLNILKSDILRERRVLAQSLQNIPQNPMIQQQLTVQAIENVTFKTALIAYAQKHGITGSDEEVAKMITSIDAFKGADGEFDKMAFKKILQSQNIAVSKFKNNMIKNIMQRNVTMPIEAEFPVSSKVVHQFKQFLDTQISTNIYHIDYQKLPDSLRQNLQVPSEQALKKIFKEKSKFFTKPELKNISYIIFNSDSLREKISVSQADMQEYYQARKNTRYFQPETRKIFQVIIDNQADVDNVYKTLNQSADFTNAAQKLGYNIEDIDLGYVDKQELDVDIRDVVFNVNLGKVTEPIKTDFGTAIFYVQAIKPQKIHPFESVKADIEKDIFKKKMQQHLIDIQVKVDDDLAGGATFDEIIQNYGSHITKQENITQSGEIYTDQAHKNFINPLISTEYINDYGVGDDVPLIKLNHHAFALLKIDQVIPKRLLSFEEAKQALIEQNLTAQKTAFIRKIMAEIEESDFSQTVLTKYNIVSQVLTFKRTDTLPKQINNPDFASVAYISEAGKVLSSVNDEQATMLQVKAVNMPEIIDLQKIADMPAEGKDSKDSDQNEQYLEAYEDVAQRLKSTYNSLVQENALEMIRKDVDINQDKAAIAQLLQLQD